MKYYYSLLHIFRKSYCFLLIAAAFFSARSNTLSAQPYWMQRGGGASADEAYSIACDGSNNTYTTGYFTGTASFGSYNLTASGVSDIFVVKTNSSGAYQWAVKAGDGGSDRGLAITCDASGNSYITGYYYGTAKFGAYTITSAGLQDVFIAKYDNTGTIQWVVSCGGSQSDIGNAIALDNNGNVVVTGQFAGTATFGTYTLTSTSNNINVFTTKLNASNGTFLWAKSGVGPHTDRGLGVACDPSGNIYITGQFTDTITFTNIYKSTLYNAIFVVKYNSSGVEQWITTAGGGTSNIANAIAVDNSSNVYITGNFSGTLDFFVTPIVSLTQKYANRIFVAKYDQNANLLWDVADGSSNQVTSNSIALDGSGNPYITGSFECIMNSYADQYGQGTFNSVGYWDIFNAAYSTSNGAWKWSRQIGGQGNNYGNGIAVSSAANIYDAGSFDQNVIITYAPSLDGYNETLLNGCPSVYCSDNYYGDYAKLNTAGNLDAFIAEPINLSRETYDFYDRSGNSCNRPRVSVCVGTSNTCEDTVQFCSSGTIKAIPNTCSNIGPTYTYLWSNGSGAASITVSKTGWYSVKQTTSDGCVSSKDSIYVIIHSPPAPPTISDNVVINTNSATPKPIRVCDHSVILTGGNYASDSTWYWTTPTNTRKDSTKITVSLHSDSGYYCFNVVNKYGCTSQTCVWVAIDTAFAKIVPKLICTTCKHDTAYLCKGSYFTMFAYDSLTNPTANQSICIPPSSATTNYWYTKPDTGISFSSKTNCPDKNNFTPHYFDSGWYQIRDTIIQSNVCGTKKYVVKDSVYARIYPVPVINLSIKGNSSLCAGDSEWIVGSGNVPFKWSNGSTRDSIHVGVGNYSISATAKNAYGCSATGSASISITAFAATTPTITMSPSNGVICPGDSIQMICKGGPYEKYTWYGPSGPLPEDTSIVYVKTAGNYYCVGIDSTPCPFSKLSNTLIVESYATPFLEVPANNNICPGDSIILNVVASNNAVIQWLAPLSGDSTIQVIKNPGTYSVKIISCGITTICTTTITKSSPFAIITATPSKTICTTGDSIKLMAAAGMANYLWEPVNSSNQVIYVKRGGTFTLTTADSFGCTATANIIISPPLADSLTKSVNISCTGSSTGLISIGIKGGATPYTYSWTPPVGTAATASNLSAGRYTVTVTDANGCAKTLSDSLSQPPKLLVPGIASFSDIKCFGLLTGSATAMASGGEPAYTYMWSPGGQTSVTATNLAAGTYTVTVTDSVGCSKTSSVIITQPTALTLKPTSKEATCIDTDGAAGVLVTGGTSPYTYLWTPGGSNSASITDLKPGIYSVLITDGNGCVDSNKITVGLDKTLNVTLSGLDSICNGQTITINVSGANSYVWSTGSTSTSITLSPTYNTNTIWVKATTGVCTDSLPYNLFIYQPLVALPIQDSICPGTSVDLTIHLTGGKPAYTYSWNNGITADSPGPISVSPTTSTTYSVSISDGCDYTASTSIYVKVLDKGTAGFIFAPDSIESGTVVNFTNKSQNTTRYYWTFGDGNSSSDSNPEHIYLGYGSFQIVLVSYAPDGCPDTATKDIFIIPKIYIPNVFTPNGDGINDVFYFTVQGATCFHANIYNRWGVLIYELNSPAEGWPGIVRQTGLPASDGTYYYILHYCDYLNGQHDQDGFITLIRNKH